MSRYHLRRVDGRWACYAWRARRGERSPWDAPGDGPTILERPYRVARAPEGGNMLDAYRRVGGA